MLGEWASWRQRIGQLLDTVAEPGQLKPAPLPASLWAAALADRPALRDAPTGGGIPRGPGSWQAQALLDSIAARAVLIAALQGEQYADAALLAQTYPENQEFLTAEVSLALQVPESDAASLVCTGTHLASRLPATLAACRAGQLPAEAAQVMLGATAVLTDSNVTAAVEAAVLPHTRWLTREGLRRRVVREVIRRDSDGADRRHAAARKKRCVSKVVRCRRHALVEAVRHRPADRRGLGGDHRARSGRENPGLPDDVGSAPGGCDVRCVRADPGRRWLRRR